MSKTKLIFIAIMCVFTVNCFALSSTETKNGTVNSIEFYSKIIKGNIKANIYLPWNYSDWLVKAQGYMIVHPFSTEALRLLWCARFHVHTDSLCWTSKPKTSAECKDNMTKRFYEFVEYQMSAGQKGWTGRFSNNGPGH